MDIHDLQATVTAGSCSSRVVFNVPKARSAGRRGRVRRRAEPQLRFRHLDDLQQCGAALDADLDRPQRSRHRSSPASRRDAACRPCPKFQLAAAATYQWEVKSGNAGVRDRARISTSGSRFTQVGDEDLGTLDLLSFGANTIGGPLTASTFTYDPELPAYDLLNLRVGVRRNGGTWRCTSTT